ncbi:MAG: UvrD-helicase domain-containing protein [Atopobiaceae bacterium]|jgi:ATP-dependent helicase/nuclease subunit A
MRQLTQDQKRIVETLYKPLFVAAGAGSGKSSTLAERVAYALEAGSGPDGAPYLSSIDEILVITFTHAAADEIKEKIRERLRESGLEDAALAVDRAWISTIHGMCSRILRRHAFDLNIDPDFQVCDEALAAQLIEDASDDVVRQIKEDNSYTRLREVFDLRGQDVDGPQTILGMAKALRNAAGTGLDGFDSIAFLGDKPQLSDALSHLMAAEERALALGRSLKAFGSKTGQKEEAALQASLDALSTFFSAAPGKRSAGLAEEVMRGVAKPNGNAYRKKEMKEVKSELDGAYETAVLTCSFASVWGLAPDLLEIARRVDELYSAKKRALGLLDNDDLLSYTLRAFREHPEIAEVYAHKFRLVMVDEFQDTNAQQVRMIELLSGEGACHLTTVGDAQQSIYRFRAADVSVFEDRARTTPADARVELKRNFRSHAEVLHFVDRVFSRGLIPGFMSLEACETRPDGFAGIDMPRIDIELLSSSASGVSADARARMCAVSIADAIASYIRAGVGPDKCALLLGRMKNVGFYLDELRRRNIPCVVSGGSTFSSSPEVSVVKALLHFLASPHDTEKGLFPVLSSAMFALDADDFCALATYRREQSAWIDKRSISRGLGDFNFLDGVQPSSRLRRAHEVLMRALSRVGSWDLEDVLLACVREAGWLTRLQAAGTEGLAVAANVLAAIRYASDLAQARGVGISQAAEEFDRWLEEAKVGPASLAAGAGGSVEIMTVHASKGLEFPLVALAECWGSSQRRGISGINCENRAGTVYASLVPHGVSFSELAIDPPESPKACKDQLDWARYICTSAQEGDDREAARLLYVGLTRAREALIVGLNVTLSKQGEMKPLLAACTADAIFDFALPPKGTSQLDYGSAELAHVRHVVLSKGDEGTEVDCPGWDPERFVVEMAPHEGFDLMAPDVEEGARWLLDARRAVSSRPDVFSYSSLHRQGIDIFGDAHDRLEPHADAPAAPLADAPAHAPSNVVLVDDESDAGAPDVEDADKATNLGSAFHVLAQAMIETGREVTGEQIVAQSRYFDLSARQSKRLEAALVRWQHSAIRQEALAYEAVRAEVPFFVSWPLPGVGEFAEGAIDLLCSDKNKEHALVVDYKTGDAHLSEREAYEHHKMQANFYSQLLYMRGYKDVSCAFVCVERACEDGEPLVLRYSFTKNE